MWMVKHCNYNLWALINATDYSIELIEHNLCHDSLCLGIGQSTCSFLSHCNLGTCWKTIVQKGKQSRLAENRLTLPRHEKHCNMSHPSRHVELLIVSWSIQNNHPLGHLQQILALYSTNPHMMSFSNDEKNYGDGYLCVRINIKPVSRHFSWCKLVCCSQGPRAILNVYFCILLAMQACFIIGPRR